MSFVLVSLQRILNSTRKCQFLWKICWFPKQWSSGPLFIVVLHNFEDERDGKELVFLQNRLFSRIFWRFCSSGVTCSARASCCAKRKTNRVTAETLLNRVSVHKHKTCMHLCNTEGIEPTNLGQILRSIESVCWNLSKLPSYVDFTTFFSLQNSPKILQGIFQGLLKAALESDL